MSEHNFRTIHLNNPAETITLSPEDHPELLPQSPPCQFHAPRPEPRQGETTEEQRERARQIVQKADRVSRENPEFFTPDRPAPDNS